MPEKLSLFVDCSFKSLDVLPGCHNYEVLLCMRTIQKTLCDQPLWMMVRKQTRTIWKCCLGIFFLEVRRSMKSSAKKVPNADVDKKHSHTVTSFNHATIRLYELQALKTHRWRHQSIGNGAIVIFAATFLWWTCKIFKCRSICCCHKTSVSSTF